jgi:DNA-binding MarR family transcriptional regulator
MPGATARLAGHIVDVDNNFVNTDMIGRPADAAGQEPPGNAAMRPRQRASKPAKASPGKTVARRKAARARRAGHAAIGLGELDAHLGYFVRRVQVWVFQDFIRRLSGIEVSPAQFSVLAVIEANPGLSQSELAATLGIERARLVRLLHRLERRSLTQRLPSSTDARRHALQLTRNGRKLLARAKALAAQHESALKLKLGPERYRAMFEAVRDF